MRGYDLFSNIIIAEWKRFRKGQYGLWYDAGLNTLIVGFIDENHSLKGRVLHNGVTQKDIDEGRYFAAWSTGYTYDNWDIHVMVYVGRYRNYSGLYGYLEFLEDATYEQIKAYFKVQELLKDINKI